MELPVIQFIQERLAEADANFETRQGTAFYDLFIKPQQLMLQPVISALDNLQIALSIKRILSLAAPDTYDETAVDDLVSNLYVTRDGGKLATTTVRVFYSTPRDKEFPALTAQFTSGTLSFFNTDDFKITSAAMALQVSGTLYYMDVPVRSEAEGDQYNVDAGLITGYVNDLDAIRITNLTKAVGGLPRETNTQLLTRAQNSIGVRDLETIKGINAILREKFPFIREIQVIGLGDAEMMRDILYNAHIGGKTDVYLRVPALTEKTSDFIGLVYDTTRELSRSYNMEVARGISDVEISSDLQTPNIVVGSMVVKEDIIESAAYIESLVVPPTVGIDLSANEWLRIQVDSLPIKQIKVSGANPSQTQRFEIINSINAAFGLAIAASIPGNKISLTSPTIGAGSQIIIYAPVAPVSPTNNAAVTLLGLGTFPTTFVGDTAHVFVENFDYTVNYVDGLLYQTNYTVGPRIPGEKTILSGQTMLSSVLDGQIVQVGLNFFLDSSVASRFLNDPLIRVRAGDEVTIEEIAGATTGTVLGNLPKTFIVTEAVTTTRLRLAGFAPTGVSLANQVQYSIKSNQVVKVDYAFNPISIDIGNKVLLEDQFNRGIRPGRTAFTVVDVPLIDLEKVEEIDPDSLEVIGEPLAAPGGYGLGGYGDGGYGIGQAGDYEFIVNSAVDRFSAFEDAVVIFRPDALSKSYRLTFHTVPEIQSIHAVTRDDLERVTGADVLAKNFVPAFVDIPLVITRDPTNINTPDNDGLIALVADYINNLLAAKGLQASQINQILEDQGVDKIRTPFMMSATVLNPDGSTTILESEDQLLFPEVTLARDTDNFSTKRIVHFYARNITITEE